MTLCDMLTKKDNGSRVEVCCLQAIPKLEKSRHALLSCCEEVNKHKLLFTDNFNKTILKVSMGRLV